LQKPGQTKPEMALVTFDAAMARHINSTKKSENSIVSVPDFWEEN
jgi:hypothetical protein